MKNYFRFFAVCVVLAFSCLSGSEVRTFPRKKVVTNTRMYENPSIETTRSGQSMDIRASDDFISGISHHFEMNFKKKQALLSNLEILLSDEENSAMQAEVFRQIEQTKLLSRTEKMDWLKSRINKLPAPFTMLLATFVAVDDLEEAFMWKNLSQLRMQIDAEKCKDNSVYGGVELVEYYFIDKIFDAVVAHCKKDSASLTNEFVNQEYNRLTCGALLPALNYHVEHPYQVDCPYWLVNHGMKHISALMHDQKQSNEQMFVSNKHAEQSEKQIIASFKELAASQ